MGNESFDPRDFQIDSSRLDIEWELQSSRCYEACRLTAQAQLSMADLKRQLEVKKAELSLAIRRDPSSFGLVKPTESAIEAYITSSQEIQDISSALNKAKYQYEMYSAAVTALEHKKKSLDALTQLRTINYYTAK